MKLWALIPMAALLAAPSSDVVRPYYAGMPPLRYQDENITVVIFANSINETCRITVPENYTLMGCTMHDGEGGTIVVLPNPCPIGHSEFYARIACHELGHVNGWKGNHPL